MTAEPLEPVPPGHGEPAPVSHPVERWVLGDDQPEPVQRGYGSPAPLPDRDGLPHCARCGYYHHATERCQR